MKRATAAAGSASTGTWFTQLLDESSLWVPTYASDSAWLQHPPFASWLLGALRPRTFVELGTHTGYSYFTFCEGIVRHGLDTRATAIDTWKGDEHAGFYGEEVYAAVSEYHDRHFASFSRLIRSTFDDALREFDDGSVDLLHIDGRHYYKDVRHDFDTWLPKLSQRSVVLLHDTQVHERDFGVHRLLQELSGRYRTFEFTDGYGLGVVAVGADVAPRAARLFELAKDTVAAQGIRDAYARLGALLVEQARLRHERARTDALESVVERQAAKMALLPTSEPLDGGFTAAAPVSAASDALLPAPPAKRGLRPTRRQLRSVLVHAETGPARRVVHPLAARLADPNERLVATSDMFDAQWYLDRYPDVAETRLDPLWHFMERGADEGRDPGPHFSTFWYRSRHADVAASGINPLVHYLKFGRAEAREVDPAELRASHASGVPVRPGGTAEQISFDTLGGTRQARADPRVARVEERLRTEIGRLDWALANQEGVLAQLDAYHAYRESPEYAAAFQVADPLVSVCIATMDRAELLIERSLPSVLAQSHRNLQIIIVGDDSRDDTGQRLAELRDDRIEFVNLPERGPYPRPGRDRWLVAGTNPANRALTMCRGQFITHLDDDDTMVPHRIEALLAAARETRSDFLWHPFFHERPDGTWARIGNGRFELTYVTTGSVFYQRFFSAVPWDIHAYRLGEPGDWNRFRKIKQLRPRLRFLDEPLLYHFKERSHPFVERDGERFVE